MNKCQEIERSIIKKYRKTIWRKFTKAVEEYELIQENDSIAVCISGGKDSFLLAKCMQELKKHGKIQFELQFIVMNPGYAEENLKQIKENAKVLDIPIILFDTNIFDAVNQQKDKHCYLCARMRRGYLYNKAKELGCNKIALGHHFDDVIETILLSIFYGGEYQSMPPKLHSTNFEGMELIRPLYLIKEKDIVSWTKNNGLRFLNCACQFTKKMQMDSKRQEMKELINKYRDIYENADINIFRSSENIKLNTVLGYQKDGIKHSFLENYNSDKKQGK